MGHLLYNHSILRNAHPREVSKYVNSLVGEHYLRVVSGPSPERNRRATLSHKQIEKISFNYLYFGEEVVVSATKPANYYHLQFILDGECGVQTGYGNFTATRDTAVIVNPFHPESFFYSEDCRKIIVRIEKERLDAFMTELIGSPIRKPVEFGSKVDMSSENVASLYRLVSFFCQELNSSHSSLLESDHLSTPVETLFLRAFLQAIPNNYSHMLSHMGPHAVPISIRKVDRFIHENLTEDITMNDLTDVSGLSIRVLYKTFERYKHMAPMAYLKKVRLEKIREKLTSGELAASTITELALEYNFNHLSRFSADYKKHFGELPSESLKFHSHKSRKKC
ncbi:AraC family transcriptional regulator [Emcibacter sp.]|uniref:AraC family transcriptional regulator n=1 Tax=Emcibacter sp. TaxID=1979954 RepID=UPI002AA79318|nr:AraC family transcriptional regulator [Emcibacter sp.]